MSKYSELVERLREAKTPSYIDPLARLLHNRDGFYAADAITKLEAEKAELVRHLHNLDAWVSGALECKDWHWDPDQREAATLDHVSAQSFLAKLEAGQ